MPDYYALLGVSADATQRDITEAYRKKARLSHPDCTGSLDGSAFREIREAYQVLADPQQRRAYDLRLGVDVPVSIETRPKPGGASTSTIREVHRESYPQSRGSGTVDTFDDFFRAVQRLMRR